MDLWIFDGFNHGLLADSLSPEYKEKSAFSTPYGLYQLVILPFSVLALWLLSSISWTRCCGCTLHRLPPICIMLSSTVRAGQSICSGKCVVRWREVQYMGCQLGGRQCTPDRENSSHWMEWFLYSTFLHWALKTFCTTCLIHPFKQALFSVVFLCKGFFLTFTHSHILMHWEHLGVSIWPKGIWQTDWSRWELNHQSSSASHLIGSLLYHLSCSYSRPWMLC